MDSILTSRSGEQFGPYTHEELTNYSKGGNVLATDLAWREGMFEWASVDQLLSSLGAATTAEKSTVIFPTSPALTNLTRLIKPLLPELSRMVSGVWSSHTSPISGNSAANRYQLFQGIDAGLASNSLALTTPRNSSSNELSDNIEKPVEMKRIDAVEIARGLCVLLFPGWIVSLLIPSSGKSEAIAQAESVLQSANNIFLDQYSTDVLEVNKRGAVVLVDQRKAVETEKGRIRLSLLANYKLFIFPRNHVFTSAIVYAPGWAFAYGEKPTKAQWTDVAKKIQYYRLTNTLYGRQRFSFP
jgi:hypothetical protein